VSPLELGGSFVAPPSNPSTPAMVLRQVDREVCVY
jgi:hypothetical protein